MKENLQTQQEEDNMDHFGYNLEVVSSSLKGSIIQIQQDLIFGSAQTSDGYVAQKKPAFWRDLILIKKLPRWSLKMH